MKPLVLALALPLFVCEPRAQGREAVEAPATSSHVDEALAHLDRAREALAAWRASADAGASLEPADLQRLELAMQGLGEEYREIHRRLRAKTERERLATRAPVRADEVKDHELENRARALTKVWVDDARALGDAGKERKAQALDEVRAALEAADAVGNLAALRTLQEIGDVAYDKAPLRPLVLPFAREGRGPILHAALYALANTEKQDADVALVHAGWERDPEALRGSVTYLMFTLSGGNLTGRSEEIALEVIEASIDRGRPSFSGMWGARVGPALGARLIEFSASPDHELRHDAIYYGLSTFQDKSGPVVEALIEALRHPDQSDARRALWGLTHGVSESQHARAVEAALKLHAARSDPKTRERCAYIVETYGTPTDLGRLER